MISHKSCRILYRWESRLPSVSRNGNGRKAEEYEQGAYEPPPSKYLDNAASLTGANLKFDGLKQ
jgi:hypothetical protein